MGIKPQGAEIDGALGETSLRDMEEGFEKLIAWREAVRLAKDVYRQCREGPLRHDRSLRDQMQRAVISISSNLAEGHERDSIRDELRYLMMAKGSAAELRSQLLVGVEIGLVDSAAGSRLVSDCRRVGAIIANLMKLKKRAMAGGLTHRSGRRDPR